MSRARRGAAVAAAAALLLAAAAAAAPLDYGGALRVDLPVYAFPSPHELAAAGPGPAFYAPPPPLGAFGAIAAQAQAHHAPEAAAAQLHAKAGLFSAPVTKLESAILQTEGFESKPLTIKENLQNIIAGIFQPKPIVDTISEVEKYGNSGDKFATVGRAVVGGAEGISNLVNKALDVPGAIFKKITRKASEKLNNLGGRLIGLV